MQVTVSRKLQGIRHAEHRAMIDDMRRAMAALPDTKPCPRCQRPSRLVGGGADQCMACLGIFDEAASPAPEPEP